MIPIRVLFVGDQLPRSRDLLGDLEASGGYEVHVALPPGAGLLALARLQPDILILNPSAGRGTPEEWRRTIERFRSRHPLGLLVLPGRSHERARQVLGDLADLGVHSSRTSPEKIRSLLDSWSGTDDRIPQAA
jgi:hypothetical protein